MIQMRRVNGPCKLHFIKDKGIKECIQMSKAFNKIAKKSKLEAKTKKNVERSRSGNFIHVQFNHAYSYTNNSIENDACYSSSQYERTEAMDSNVMSNQKINNKNQGTLNENICFDSIDKAGATQNIINSKHAANEGYDMMTREDSYNNSILDYSNLEFKKLLEMENRRYRNYFESMKNEHVSTFDSINHLIKEENSASANIYEKKLLFADSLILPSMSNYENYTNVEVNDGDYNGSLSPLMNTEVSQPLLDLDTEFDL
ncbi:hypothetical protein K502DRAFT_331304 [Neoconidiobolus thromboides FSU 785]|nr:hypothetical protein K502DRAFT_331304 [Neoconidiobolus thromboides FSU 785]